MANLLQTIKNFIDGKKPTLEVEQEIIKPENEQVKLTPFEEKLNVVYMGCYNVNPVNPIITQELGTVHNQADCINMGKTAGYQYVALQDGNTCFGTNNINNIQSSEVSRRNCNMVCDESSAGYCGGVLKNQVYATSIIGTINNENPQQILNEKSNLLSEQPNKESFKNLENFALYNKEMKMFDSKISQIDMLCQEPINKYNLLMSLLIILLLAYIMIEIIYKKI
jgi:hypothetical protein